MNRLTSRDAQALAKTWVQTWNTRDLDQILALYAEDIVFSSPLGATLGSALMQTKSELHPYFRAALARSPNLHFELEAVFPGATGVAMILRNDRGQRICETLTYDEMGHISVCTVYRDEGGA